jgi:hypothetical protein
MTGLVWYVSYGSNMLASRFHCYLTGGAVAGHTHPGCRDPRLPRLTRACELPGGIYFATRSPIWGGGRAFYDPTLPTVTAARAYLITTAQFSDLVAQEMYREPGVDLDLRDVFATGRLQLGPGRYETLLHLGDHDGHPMLTFTAPWTAATIPHVPPAPAYLRTVAAGLREAHAWPPDRIDHYLAAMQGHHELAGSEGDGGLGGGVGAGEEVEAEALGDGG